MKHLIWYTRLYVYVCTCTCRQNTLWWFYRHIKLLDKGIRRRSRKDEAGVYNMMPQLQAFSTASAAVDEVHVIRSIWQNQLLPLCSHEWDTQGFIDVNALCTHYFVHGIRKLNGGGGGGWYDTVTIYQKIMKRFNEKFSAKKILLHK